MDEWTNGRMDDKRRKEGKPRGDHFFYPREGHTKHSATNCVNETTRGGGGRKGAGAGTGLHKV